MSEIKIKILVVVAVVFGFFSGPRLSFADSIFESYLTRGEAVKIVVERFELERKNSDFLQKCFEQIDYCLFVFSAKSRFDGITTDPIRLYPDVFVRNRYYKEITIASLLEIVEGYIEKKQSPFRPHKFITKKEALEIFKRTVELNSQNRQTGTTKRQSSFSFLSQVNTAMTEQQKTYLSLLPVLTDISNIEDSELITREEFLSQIDKILKD